jgi:hypothetical protein
MLFKGINLEIGDIVEFTTKAKQETVQTAAIAQINNGQIIVFSNNLPIYNDMFGTDWFDENSYLDENVVLSIKRRCTARKAVTRNSGDRLFRRNQKVGLYVNGMVHVCKVIAAFDSTIYFEPECRYSFAENACNFIKLQ